MAMPNTLISHSQRWFTSVETQPSAQIKVSLFYFHVNWIIFFINLKNLFNRKAFSSIQYWWEHIIFHDELSVLCFFQQNCPKLQTTQTVAQDEKAIKTPPVIWHCMGRQADLSNVSLSKEGRPHKPPVQKTNSAQVWRSSIKMLSFPYLVNC